VVLLAQSLLLAPLTAHAAQQAGKIYRIGHLATPEFEQAAPAEQRAWPTFVDALKGLGWSEGKNFVFERRVLSYSTRTEIQQAAADLVRKNVDVIVLVGGARAAMVQRGTQTTPIVTLAAGDLVGSGIVPSLSRPGGNITGMQSYAPEIMGKRLQMLRDLNPSLTRVAVLRCHSWHAGILAAYRKATDDAAQKLGLKVRCVYFDAAASSPACSPRSERRAKEPS
jgi:ABC-type uncharacterized transport system substrate-binding protein